MEYRVEQKYFVTEDTIAYLKKRLSCLMDYDAHAGEGGYLIRSIYFDDMYDTCLDENESGLDRRQKFRIRCYNNDPSVLHLECKEKRNGFTKKTAETLTMDDCLLYMQGKVPDLKHESSFLQKRLYAGYLAARMQAVNIVEYERVAMVEKIGNVRITFDTNIGGTEDVGRFFETNLYAQPVLPAGTHILEVKYDETLPDGIHKILTECNLARTAFSKYYYVGNLFKK